MSLFILCHQQKYCKLKIIIGMKHFSQLTFTCSNPTKETLEQGVEYVQS